MMTPGQPIRTGAALVIGLGRYASAEIPRLPFSIADADAVAEILVDPDLCGLSRQTVVVLKDEDARRDAIVHHIAHWLPRQAAGADIAVLYFAGHGTMHRLGPREEAFLMPYDAQIDDLVTWGIAMSDVGRWLEAIDARSVILLVDCCHAGHIVTRRDATAAPPRHDYVFPTSLLRGIAGKGRFVLASCDDGQYSLEAPELGHGLFTHHLLNGMRGAADRDGDGLVGITELFEYVAATVERDSQTRFGQLQKPWYSATGTGGVYIAARPPTPARPSPFVASHPPEPRRLPAEAGPTDSDVLSLLRAIERSQDTREISTVLRYLASESAAMSAAAQAALQAIGWSRAAAAIEELSGVPDPIPVGFALKGLAAIEASPDLVTLLDRLADRLKGDLRNTAILLVERKRLGLSLEATQALFREIRSPYRVRRALGQGLLTAAYLVQDEIGEMEHVIRLLRPEFAQQPRVRGQFMEVSQRAMRLVHQNLVLTREVRAFPDRAVYYALRDYVDGVTLRELLVARRAFSLDQVVHLLRRVLEALTPVHELGLCHGGIKPSNIFVCPGEKILLGDLSLPLQVGMHALDRLSYDFRYAPPEIIVGEGTLGPPSDFYALGCVAYELLCGAPPFVSDSHLELTVMHARERVIPPSERGIALPAAAEAFVLRLLARAPAARFSTLLEARRALETLAAGLGTAPAEVAPAGLAGDTSLFTAADRTRLSLDSPSPRPPASTPQAAPTAMKTIGKHRILEQIGRGGMGTVYKAHDPVLDRVVAVKVISSGMEITDELRNRFFREAQAVAKLSHPNILTVYDMGEDNGQLYIVMEYLDGEELKQVMAQRRPLSFQAKLDIMVQVCAGLGYAHQRGVIHRDVKPGNIFVLRTGAVKILDFGLARITSAETGLTRTGVVMGSLRYMAPEQARGRVDHRSDIFSAGSVFYELLTHRPPFPGDDPIEILDRLRSEDPEPVARVDPSIPLRLSAVIERALRKDPDDRFASFDQMYGELELIRRQDVEHTHYLPEVTPAEAAQAEGQPLHLHETAQFTVYRPRIVRPAVWYQLLAFAHLAERPPGAPDPIAEVQRQAHQVLGVAALEYQEVTQDSRQAVPDEGEITFVPQIPGVEFNPPSRTFRWQEAVHREEFRLRAGPELDGTTGRGRLAVFHGRILLAEVTLAIRVDRHHSTVTQPDAVATDGARRYRRIFTSYSHRDQSIVEEVAHYARVLGDRYMIDVEELRSGEVWNDRLKQLIDEADIFQLFWSWNSMRSPLVRREWEHALSLARPAFVRPTYWEEPLPTAPSEGLPPQELANLHFHLLIRPTAPPPFADRTRGFDPTVTRRGGPVDVPFPASASEEERTVVQPLPAPPSAGAHGLARALEFWSRRWSLLLAGLGLLLIVFFLLAW